MEPLYSLSATRLVELLSSREISSEQLTRAHLDRIDLLDRKVLAFTQVFREKALGEARRADELLAKGRPLGPLHGLPVTVKESFDIEGLPATMGVPSRASHRASSDAALVRLLREAGAVVLGRTNVAQFLLYHESRNPLFGQTANPFALTHSPGGSSGGEAAAIAAGFSPLGIGGDIGGSIRNPAHFSGVCGLKPSLDRLPCQGSHTALAGQETIRGQAGPLARTARDIALFMAAMPPARMAALDGRVPPLPWRDVSAIPVEKLRVGYYTDDGVMPASHAMVRVVERARDVLAARGCEVKRFTPPDVRQALVRYFAALSADGGDTIGPALEGGEVDQVLAGLRRMATLPPTLRKVIVAAARLAGDPLAADLLAVAYKKSVAELWSVTAWIRAYRFSFTRAMDDAGVDVLLSPPHATPAMPHGLARDFAAAGSYAMLYNLLQFPAGVVPAGAVRTDEARRDGAKGRIGRRAAEIDARSAGLPVGVQIAGRPWADEEVVATMIALEDGLRGDQGFPQVPVALSA
jgi:fatty acid amide hydrolase